MLAKWTPMNASIDIQIPTFISIYSVFQRSTKVDVELVIIITIDTSWNDS
jgi:hypothetical protein